jgi:GT2 family glycosyltransferase
MEDENISITVIIPTMNVEDRIENCLTAVLNQTLHPSEIIIVDGHSRDKTVANASRFPVKILYEEYHTRAGACQIGVENAKSEFVVFTDADCMPRADWIENLIHEFDNDIIGVGGSINNLGSGRWENSINLAMGTFLGSANSVQGRIFENNRYVKSISGCNCAYRRKDILDVGGFNLELNTAEDSEINNRLLKKGKLLYTPKAIVLHDHKRGLERFAKRMFQYGYGRARSKIWDIQIMPPIFAIILLGISIFYIDVFLIFLSIYLLFIIFMGIKISLQEMDYKYLFSLPIVYMLVHGAYALGFWIGISQLQNRRNNRSKSGSR